jgi:hypothetical protein
MPFDTAAYLAARQAGNNWMGQGIMSAGNSISAAIEQHKAESKRLKAFRAMAVDGLGMDPEEVDRLDADTLQGKLQSVAVKSAISQQQREQEDQQYQQTQRAAGQQFQQRLAPVEIGPNQPITPERILGAASESGLALDPRIIAQFAEQNGPDETPQGWTSPTGNPFVKYHNTLLPDRGGMDASAPPQTRTLDNGTEQVWNGRAWTNLPAERNPRPVPDAYTTTLEKILESINSDEANIPRAEKKEKGLGTPEFYRNRIATNKKSLTNHVNRYKSLYPNENFWPEEESRLGLKPAGAKVRKYNPATGKIE